MQRTEQIGRRQGVREAQVRETPRTRSAGPGAPRKRVWFYLTEGSREGGESGLTFRPQAWLKGVGIDSGKRMKGRDSHLEMWGTVGPRGAGGQEARRVKNRRWGRWGRFRARKDEPGRGFLTKCGYLKDEERQSGQRRSQKNQPEKCGRSLVKSIRIHEALTGILSLHWRLNPVHFQWEGVLGRGARGDGLGVLAFSCVQRGKEKALQGINETICTVTGSRFAGLTLEGELKT